MKHQGAKYFILTFVISLLAKGLVLRQKAGSGNTLDIIIAENITIINIKH